MDLMLNKRNVLNVPIHGIGFRVKTSVDSVLLHWTDPMLKVFPPEDKDTQSAIERTAISVAMNGIEAEETMRRTKAEDKHYSYESFLINWF